MATIIEPIDTQQAPLNGQLTAGKGKKTATFALVDDSKIVLITWEQAWPLGTLHVFASPEEFWAYEENNIGFLDELTGLISDFNFAKGAIQNGVDFARDVRAKAPHLPIVLASNVDSECEEIEKGLFVGRLKKDIPKAEAVLEAFKFDFRDLEVLT